MLQRLCQYLCISVGGSVGLGCPTKKIPWYTCSRLGSQKHSSWIVALHHRDGGEGMACKTGPPYQSSSKSVAITVTTMSMSMHNPCALGAVQKHSDGAVLPHLLPPHHASLMHHCQHLSWEALLVGEMVLAIMPLI